MPAGADTLAWYTLAEVEFGTVDIGDQTVVYAGLTLTDGAPGDDTDVDGQMVFGPSGLARLAADAGSDGE